ncbi:hypothetical protein MWU50_10345 [Flavobacteriaceae bacterium S0862]|nr:hypothetical protein [Flavobacteriaceae bacterium S0862]
MKTVIIQEKLLRDLRVAITEHNTTSKHKLKIDVAVFFLSLFNSIPSYYREDEQTDNVSLDSQRLKFYYTSYKKYFNLFETKGFIEKVKSYGADINKCNVFKLSNKYLDGGIVSYKIKNKVLLKRFDTNGLTKFHLAKNQFCIKTRPHLVKFFDKDLTIDSKAAYNEIKGFINDEATRRRYLTSATLITEFHNQVWKYSIKPKSDNRLHSNLTRSSKILRKHIKYDGNPIIGVDLKTSQPFFLCVIIKAILKKDMGLFKLIKATEVLPNNVIKTLINLDLNRNELIGFVQSVLNKDFYGEFENQIDIQYDENGMPFRMISNYSSRKIHKSRSRLDTTKKTKRKVIYMTNRELVKAVVMEIFYSKPKTTIKEAAIFRKAYPSVTKIFKCIHENEVKFSYVLQYIEAYVLLDYTAKKINKKYPNMPLFSIHDALVTTKPWKYDLIHSMAKHVQYITTLQPNIDIEEWNNIQILKDAI